MGCSEGCLGSRKSDAYHALQEHMRTSSAEELRTAIKEAEAAGVDALTARQRYADLARRERQSPMQAREMLRWAMAMQDGAVLYSVIKEVSISCPNHEGLPMARQRLFEHQIKAKQFLQSLAKKRDVQGMGTVLDKAKRMGIQPPELYWAEQHLRTLENASAAAFARDLEMPPDVTEGQAVGPDMEGAALPPAPFFSGPSTL
eukprot:CAMPEP_0194479456 /NCGR_PEP_ID=MMETSP0253-20130528/2572_1 /TAXON_ID=2966 /ORGANISM="Noctiluca scintillans" /LENGTH=201 /DNA_ID=CAMNT_0039318681 /DNA_START=77 /DNA_END=682 /DNA_ORIENTATION=+